MILQALMDYYDRRSADPESDIAPEGWEKRHVPFVIVLDEQGKLVQIEDTRESDGKKIVGKSFLVPLGVKRSSGVAANLLWDTVPYVFGPLGLDDTEILDLSKKAKARTRAIDQQHQFVEKIRQTLPDDPQAQAIIHFLETVKEEDLERSACWGEMKKTKAVVSFRFQNDLHLFCESSLVHETLAKHQDCEVPEGLCLVSGKKDIISSLHTAIKGVKGATPSGANLVSFNLDAFCSYGKQQGYNAPIGEKSMFAYTTALNELLSPRLRQHLSIGDVTMGFWGERSSQFENDFSFYFSELPKDDPGSGTDHIKSLFEAPLTGGYCIDTDKTGFYVLGLSPNVSRISIRFWQYGTVASFAAHIRQYFKDLEIVKSQNEPLYYSLWRLLVNIAPQEKSENIPPNIAGEMMMAILNGNPFPLSILQCALRRIHAATSRRVTSARAALIKGYLNRYLRMYHQKGVKEMGVTLDSEQPSVGYQLGRLFALLEKIQKDASGRNLNSTITERYYSAASTSPVTVFGTLLRLMKYHLAKLSTGASIAYTKQVGEVMSHVSDFPTHLDLQEQGRFAIGYYHQQQALYTKKESQETERSE